MKYSMAVDIDAPVEAVAAVAAQPAEWKNWLEGLKEFGHIGGADGKVGARYRLVFQTGKMEMEFTAEILQCELPEVMRMQMDACNLLATTTTRLRAISAGQTRCTSEQDFAFKGLVNKIVGFLLQREFKAQTRRHLANFKRLVESHVR